MKNLYNFIFKLLIGIAVVAGILVALYYIVIYAITDENGDLNFKAKVSFNGKYEISSKNGQIHTKVLENNSSELNKTIELNTSKE